jgi:hypothetical protein
MLVVVKRLATLFAIGGLVGDLSAVLVGPGFIEWYNTAGSGTAALCSCKELAHDTTMQILKAQAVGTVTGAVLFVVVGELGYRQWRGWRASKGKASTSQTTQTTTTTSST